MANDNYAGNGRRGPGLKDRVASAFASAFVMAVMFVSLALTAAFLAVFSAGFHLLDGHGASQFDGTARLVMFFDTFIVTAFCVFLALAALAGFALGSERMTRLLGVLWLTQAPTRGEKWLLILMAGGLLGTMVVYALRKLLVA